jgi:predicted nucleic acid-binding protein
MNGYLLDTNVISEYGRPWPPDARVRTWVDAQNLESIMICEPSTLLLGCVQESVLGVGINHGLDLG